MKGRHAQRDATGSKPAGFATTQWSIVLAAQQDTGEAKADALEGLCRVYWYPLYAFARRRGMTPENACDATQEFFCRLLDRDFLRLADPQRGRFRSFLVKVFERFLISERTRALALKRGGGRIAFSIDAAGAEARYRLEPADPWTPDALFERRWALTLLDEALRRLEREYSENARRDLFAACQPLLTTQPREVNLGDVAKRLAMAPGALRVALHRLRTRYREILRSTVADTLDDPRETDAELRSLLAAVRGKR